MHSDFSRVLDDLRTTGKEMSHTFFSLAYVYSLFILHVYKTLFHITEIVYFYLFLTRLQSIGTYHVIRVLSVPKFKALT